jgi:putative copper resistance protein D
MRTLAAVVGALAVAGPLAAVALAHGPDVPPEPGPATVVTGWSFDATIALPLLASLGVYLWLVRRVDARHPANPVSRSQVACFVGALVAIEVALQSGVEAYDTTLFSVHMIQHILLMFVAAPLIALSAPITLLLRAVDHRTRVDIVMPILHSRVMRVLAFPVVTWVLFAAVMWGSHFSPLFEAALEDPLVHDLEHLLFLVAALLFWWPVVGRDPAPWRMPYPARVVYLFLQMPQNTFLSVAIYSASSPLYAHYATLGRTWGPTVLADQQAAGAIMWVVGDLTFLVAVLGVVLAWMHAEERDTDRKEAHIDAERAAIRQREAALAARLAAERPAAIGGGQSGSGADR